MRRSSFKELAHYYGYKRRSLAFQKFTPKKHSFWSRFLVLLFIVLFLILLASLAGFFIFGRRAIEFKNESVSVDIKGTDQVTIGQKEIFIVKVKNKEKAELRASEIIVNFPQGFYFVNSSEPYKEKLAFGCVWVLGKLAQDEERMVEFEGYFLSPSIDSEETKFEAVLNFQIAGFTANFKKATEKEIVVKPALSFSFNPADEVFLGQEIYWEILVENQSENTVKDIELKLELPQDFELSSSKIINETLTPISQAKNTQVWELKEFKARERKSLLLCGIFREVGKKVVKFSIILTGPDGRLFVQQEIQKEISAKPSSFILQFLGEKSIFPDWGIEVPVSFVYENRADQGFEDVFFKLTFNRPEYIDWQSVLRSNWQWRSGEKLLSTNIWQVSQEGGVKILTWQTSLIPGLKEIRPGESGEIRFNLFLIPLKEAIRNLYKQAGLEISLETSGSWSGETRFFLKAAPIQIKIKNVFNISAEARYYDDEMVRVGQGPMPPKVDERTVYCLYFDLKNTTNPVQDIEVKVVLSSNIEWFGGESASLGKLSFDSQARAVNWHIDRLEPYSGGSYSLVGGSFLVAVTPKEEDRGQVLPLTNLIQLSAIDSFTGQKISQELSPLDTNLSGDPLMAGKGRVE